MLFFVGKLTSWFVYQACWNNAVEQDLSVHSATSLLVSHWKLWPIHAIWIVLSANVTWAELPVLHILATVIVATMTWGAVFRFGAADVANFFWIDRVLSIVFCIGVFFSPIFVYPAVLVSCCLQYTVSAWRLGPGYSNLLGYEFIRGTACVILPCVAFSGAAIFVGNSIDDFRSSFLLAIIGVQSSHYFNHGLAKIFLGNRWYTWAAKNRLECLVVNSYLRGWRLFRSKASVLRFARWVRRFRIPLCASVLALEVGFVLVLFDLYLAVAFFIAAIVFHFMVWVLTGLAEMEYIMNHSAIIFLLLTSAPFIDHDQFGWPVVGILACCLTTNIVWVGWNRSRMLAELQSTGKSPSRSYSDPFDHLMAWWDSPYMRMYSHVVTTESGNRYWLPVSKLSPYDTALTDIHTHIMIMNAHEGFDPQAFDDKQIARTGVWGLVISEGERDFLYSLMDHEKPDHRQLKHAHSIDPWICDGDEQSHGPAEPLRRLFIGINRMQDRFWFRLLMRYPHFPGEDLVPDICPIVADEFSTFRFDQPIESVQIQRVKTLYTGEDIELVEQSVLGTIKRINPIKPVGQIE